ncbi:MAG TPA: hypothetical protein VK821_13025, partial [Dehalococcoidia bacterium]|nr:hypothetical protein [Dehalococcoidia bacterium]
KDDNPLGLCPAHRLYENPTYGRLVDRFGEKRVYILSAGWGLIGADFLTPYYDITFSQDAEAYKRRKKPHPDPNKPDPYEDFRMLSNEAGDHIVFFGGKDYLPLFYRLTASIRSKKTVFYNSAHIPQAAGYEHRRFETAIRTNWHYRCANDFLDGEIDPG